MEPVTLIKGHAAALDRSNIDTDVIVRIDRLANKPREALGPYALEALRFQPDGNENPSCVLNQDPFRAAPILIVRKNFGCGSSREGAVWALKAYGVRCIIAESFADIFAENCFQNGILPVTLSEIDLNPLFCEALTGVEVAVDLRAQRVYLSTGLNVGFSIDPARKEALVEGLDDISLTQKKAAVISQWQRQNQLNQTWIWNS